MIAKTYIYNNLRSIESQYKKACNQKQALFYAKLAIMELCGWIEQSMDDIILVNAKKILKLTKNVDYVSSSIIEKTHSFAYKQHFRKMLIGVIGIINVERLEKKLNVAKFVYFKANLSCLKRCRDEEAHKYIKDTTVRLDAPSVTIQNFKIVYEGLKDIEYKLKRMRL